MQFFSESLTNYIDILEEADKAFVGNIAKDAVAQAQADIFFQLGIRDKALMKSGLDLVAASTGAYHKSMLDIVGKFQTGSLDYNTAFSQWRSATKTAMTGMFRGGGMTVGNPFFQDLAIPPSELRLMARYLNKEGAYFKQFLRDMANPKHVPASQIPRDASGKRLPGYTQKQWDYAQRAGMYPDSLKAMRYNGMVRGAGSNMEIHWVLGVPQTVHCVDCPTLSGRTWTGETLPTVPGAGDTKCGWKCYCHLEFVQKVSRTTFDLAGSGTRGALMAPGRQAKMIDPKGTEVGGQLQAEVEKYMAKMYKARQMVAITTGADKIYWIGQRKMWNQRAIELGQAGNLRIVPTISSSALVKTIRAVQAKGGLLITDYTSLVEGQEIWFVRGDYSTFAVVGFQDGVRVLKTSSGIVLRPDGNTDILFSPGGSKFGESTIVSERRLAHGEKGINDSYKVKLSNGESGIYKVAGSESEVAAYEVAKALGWDDLVPETVFKVGSIGKGSVQKWVPGELWKSYRQQNLISEYQRQRMATFDILIGNWDRHGSNFLVSNNALIAIDSGFGMKEALGYGIRPIAGFNKLYELDVGGWTKILQSVKDDAVRLLNNRSSLDKVLRTIYADSPYVVDKFWRRVQTFSKMTDFNSVKFSNLYDIQLQ